MEKPTKYRFVGRYEYEINTPNEKWVINHNFGHGNLAVMAFNDMFVLIPSHVSINHDHVEVNFDSPTNGTLVLINNIEQNLWLEICKIESKKS